MPNPVIHFVTANKVNPTASLDFHIGNIAPDSVTDRERKDITHMRNAPDAELALNNFAAAIDVNNEYLKGIALHLFTDMKWNNSVLRDFIDKIGGDWWEQYSAELISIESYSYYHMDWVPKLWEQIDNCESFNFTETDGISAENIKSEVKRVLKTKTERFRKQQAEGTVPEPPFVITLPVIERFTDEAAAEYNRWFNNIKT